MAEIAKIEAETLEAEEAVQAAAADAKAKSEAAAEAGLAAGQLKTEVETLAKLLTPVGDSRLPPVLDRIKVEAGYEMALAAALGDDLDAPVAADAPAHWRVNAAGETDPALPAGVEPLVARVEGPPELTRRLRQIGVVAAGDGARLQRTLKSGQRLVSREGHLWRWDGFVAAAEVSTAAATRLAERSRLGALARAEGEARQAAESARAAAEAAAQQLAAAQAEEKRLRQLWREAQTKVAQTREVLTAMERQARETEVKIAAVADAKDRAHDALAEAQGHLSETEAALAALGGMQPWRRTWRRRRRRLPTYARASPRAAPSSLRWSASIAPAPSGRRPSASSASAGRRGPPAPTSRLPRSRNGLARPRLRSPSSPPCPP